MYICIVPIIVIKMYIIYEMYIKISCNKTQANKYKCLNKRLMLQDSDYCFHKHIIQSTTLTMKHLFV